MKSVLGSTGTSFGSLGSSKGVKPGRSQSLMLFIGTVYPMRPPISQADFSRKGIQPGTHSGYAKKYPARPSNRAKFEMPPRPA